MYSSCMIKRQQFQLSYLNVEIKRISYCTSSFSSEMWRAGKTIFSALTARKIRQTTTGLRCLEPIQELMLHEIIPFMAQKNILSQRPLNVLMWSNINLVLTLKIITRFSKFYPKSEIYWKYVLFSLLLTNQKTAFQELASE